MNHGTACGALVLTMAVGAGCSSSESDKRFGELPPNAVARLDLSGVRAEIGFRLLVDPALVRGQLPKGLRPRTLKFAPTRDSLLRAEFLPKHPGWENFITGQLAFLAYDTASLNGVPVTNSAPVVHALWWVQAEPAADSLDARAYGDMWVELGSFWDSAAAVRVRAIGIAGDVAPIEMRQTDSTTWVMHLVLPDADVRATCRLRGTATPAGYPLPAYSTIWAAGPILGQFTLYTHYGHMNQDCDAELVADGAGPLASSLRNGIEIQKALGGRVFSGTQFGWRARAGVYQH